MCSRSGTGRRHGASPGSTRGRRIFRLTDNGRRLAERMRPVLARNAFELVLCSPMQRARETCELAGLGDKALIDSDLVEWNYGEYEGLTPKQIHEVAPGWLIFRDGCPGGEAPEQVGARDRPIARGRRRHRAIRARTCAAHARGALHRVARGRRTAFSAEYGYLVCPRILPRDTSCADLERASHRLERDDLADRKARE